MASLKELVNFLKINWRYNLSSKKSILRIIIIIISMIVIYYTGVIYYLANIIPILTHKAKYKLKGFFLFGLSTD